MIITALVSARNRIDGPYDRHVKRPNRYMQSKQDDTKPGQHDRKDSATEYR
jgi:hypothetical protein